MRSELTHVMAAKQCRVLKSYDAPLLRHAPLVEFEVETSVLQRGQARMEISLGLT